METIVNTRLIELMFATQDVPLSKRTLLLFVEFGYALMLNLNQAKKRFQQAVLEHDFFFKDNQICKRNVV